MTAVSWTFRTSSCFDRSRNSYVNDLSFLCTARQWQLLDYNCMFDASVFAWRKHHHSPIPGSFHLSQLSLIPSSGLFRWHVSVTARALWNTHCGASVSTITVLVQITRGRITANCHSAKLIWFSFEWDSFTVRRFHREVRKQGDSRMVTWRRLQSSVASVAVASWV